MKWVIVTGDSGTLGSTITESLLQTDEFGVIGISRTKNDEINNLLKQYQFKYHHINFDLSNVDQISLFYKKQIKIIGSIYGLVNNAAYAYDDIVSNAKIYNINLMFTINVFSPIILTKYAIRDMLLNNTNGSIVHISSVCAHTGYKGLSMYAATKGAMEAFSKTVAREWGEFGIRSNCVAPGFMSSGMNKNLTTYQRERIYKRTSLKNETDKNSVAKSVKFLLSDESNSITGTVFHVDGGTT